MSYRLGVDLGTTWTAAALWEAGKASIFPLGQQRAAIPSVVLLRDDGTVLTGEAALRRAISEPERVAREFKRRIGDTTPIIVAGTPYPAEALTARLLRSVIDQVSAQQGRPPEQVVISHPANWGPYKLELLHDILRRADLDPNVCGLITEPEAAAISYAAQERIGIGQNVCVYDLGGGTFDVAVLQRTASGFSILGRPDGIERLGGIDFDAAVYAHVTSILGSHYHDLDPEDPLTLSAIARLRQDCVEAKEALSADTDTTIPVLLPKYQTELRLTRSEFETLIRPPLQDTIETTRRAIASAGLGTSDIHHILLVGGSSRIPLISQLVQRELDLPTTVDADPKHAIALGAATFRAASAPAPVQMPTPAPAPTAAPTPMAAPRPGPPPDNRAAPLDVERTTRTPAPTEPPSRPTPRVAPGAVPVSGPTPVPGPTPIPDPTPIPGRAANPAPPPGLARPAAFNPPPTPAPATPPPGSSQAQTRLAGGPPSGTPANPGKARPANVAGLTPPPGSGRVQRAVQPAVQPVSAAPADARPQPPPPASLTSFTPPSAAPPSAASYKPPPPPPPGGSEAPRTPRPAPPPAVLHPASPSSPPAQPVYGAPAGAQPLISSKAGSVPAGRGPVSASGPPIQPLSAAAPVRSGSRPGRAAMALIVVVVALMLGFGAFLLMNM